MPPDDTVLDDPDEERAGRHAAALRELTEIGMELARGLRGQALEAGDLALAFSRLSRAIRLTIALEDRLAAGRDERQRAADDERAAVEAEASDARVRANIRALINRQIVHQRAEDAIETAVEGREAESLFAALREKLDETDAADFADLEPAAIVMRICKDLGVPYDPALWDDEDDPAPCERPAQPYWDAPRKPIPVWDRDPATCRFQPP